jgi:hypothetical protein
MQYENIKNKDGSQIIFSILIVFVEISNLVYSWATIIETLPTDFVIPVLSLFNAE